MKEIVFIRNNIDRWQKAEHVMDDTFWYTPDELAEMYVGITSDLAFAMTHYPESRITVYLNNLASAIHNEIYKNNHRRTKCILSD